MGKCKVVVLYPQLLAKVSKHVIIELLSIVRDEDPKNSELKDDALPEEVTNIFLRDGC